MQVIYIQYIEAVWNSLFFLGHKSQQCVTVSTNVSECIFGLGVWLSNWTLDWHVWSSGLLLNITNKHAPNHKTTEKAHIHTKIVLKIKLVYFFRSFKHEWSWQDEKLVQVSWWVIQRLEYPSPCTLTDFTYCIARLHYIYKIFFNL